MFNKKLSCFLTISALAAGTIFGPIIGMPVSFQTQTVSAAATTIKESNMPSNLRSSIEWVYKNRMVKEGSVSRRNTIFDQIYAGNGTLNYVVRWQSKEKLTLEARKKMESMISRQINNWAQYLVGYDGWPYDHITVKIVGWAVTDSSIIEDKQSDEIVYIDCSYDSLSEGSSIPSQLPNAPSAISRFDHFEDSNYSYPDGLDKRFDMYLWGTTGFNGGAGGDWGQRMSEEYILSQLDSNEVHILEHEIGHGFGLPDFYEEADRPSGGFPTNTIMWAGDSMSITSWDYWMLRYTWSQLNDDSSRFPSKTVVSTPTPSVQPSITPTPTPSTGTTQETGKALQLDASASGWTGAYNMNVTLKNTSSTHITNWKIVLKSSEADINSIWCAKKSASGSSIMITPESWNANVAGNGSVSFGCGANGSVPSKLFYTISYEMNGKWYTYSGTDKSL